MTNCFGMVSRVNKEALISYQATREAGERPSSAAIVAALKVCSNSKDLESGRRIHSDVQGESGEFWTCSSVGNTLVDMYAKCGSMKEAHGVFQSLPCHTVVSWNCLIQGYAEGGNGGLALQLFREMQERGFVPSRVTYLAALKACGKLAEKEQGRLVQDKVVKVYTLERIRELHASIGGTGNEQEVVLSNSLISLYAKCGSMAEASRLFDRMIQKTVVSWTCLVQGFADSGEPDTALKLYDQMLEQEFVPDAVTFLAAINALSCKSQNQESDLSKGKPVKAECLERGRDIHAQAQKLGLHLHKLVASRLVDMYSKCGSMEDARAVFESIQQKDLVAWTALILGYIQSRQPELAMQNFEQMQKEGCVPDAVTYAAVLKACGGIAALATVQEIEAEVCNAGLDSEEVVTNGLIDSFGKCGSLVDAERVFNSLTTKSLVAWNALMDGYSRRGDAGRVFNLLEKVVEQRLRPNEISLLCVLTACCRAGWIEQGKRMFESMESVYGVRPGLKHFTVMVQMLARANRVNEAVEMVNRMPSRADAVAWTALLDACSKGNNLDTGRAVFETAACGNEDADYVLMANLYSVSSSDV